MDRRYHHRPTSVTVISVLLLLAAAGGAFLLAATFLKPGAVKQDPVLLGCLIGSLVVTGSSGLFMLRGANWARILYFAVCFPAKIISCFFVPPGLVLLNLVITVLFSLCLVSENANR